MSGLDSLSNVSVDEIIRSSETKKIALTRKNSDLRPGLQLRVPIDLTSARDSSNPLQLDGPFTAFYVENAGTTDSVTQGKMSFGGRENLKDYTVISQNDSAEFQEPVRTIFITNTAQSGKTLTLILYLGANFRPGSLILTNSGGVNIYTGSGLTTNACQNVTGTASKLFDVSTVRKKVTIQVLTGAGIYLGGVNTVLGASGAVAATTLVGIFVPVGGTFEWQNSGACYAITDGGTSLVSLNTES